MQITEEAAAVSEPGQQDAPPSDVAQSGSTSSAFGFIKEAEPSSSNTADSAATVTALDVAPAPPIMGGTKKKRNAKFVRPGHAREEQLGTMEIVPTPAPAKSLEQKETHAEPVVKTRLPEPERSSQPGVVSDQVKPIPSGKPVDLLAQKRSMAEEDARKREAHRQMRIGPTPVAVSSGAAVRPRAGSGRDTVAVSSGAAGRPRAGSGRDTGAASQTKDDNSVGSKLKSGLSSFFGRKNNKGGATSPAPAIQDNKPVKISTFPKSHGRADKVADPRTKVSPSGPTVDQFRTIERPTGAMTNSTTRGTTEVKKPRSVAAASDPESKDSSHASGSLEDAYLAEPKNNKSSSVADTEVQEAHMVSEISPNPDNEKEPNEQAIDSNEPSDGHRISTVVTESSKQTLADAEAEIDATEARLNELDVELSEVISSIRNACEGRFRNRKLLQNTARELDNAVQNEDYDLAASLESKIEELTMAVQSASDTDHCGMRTKVGHILRDKAKIWQEQSVIRENTVTFLRDSIHLQEEEVRSFEVELDSIMADERVELDTRQARTDRAQGHLDLDRSHLDEQIERYKKLAAEKTATFVKEKSRLSSSRDEVRSRISELELELRRLRQEDEDLSKGIDVQDERIMHAESGLSSEKTRMDDEARGIAMRQSELDVEIEALGSAREKLDASTSKLQQEYEKLSESLEDTRNSISSAIQIKQEIEERIASTAEFVAEYSSLDDPLKVVETGGAAVEALKVDVAAESQKVQRLTASVVEKKSEASALRKTLEEISAQVPELEQSKKLAVSDRNFKEAARIASEIKELNERAEMSKTRQQELLTVLLTETEELNAAKDERAALAARLEEAESAHDSTVLERLRERCSVLGKDAALLADSNAEVAMLIAEDVAIHQLWANELCVKLKLDDIVPVPEARLPDVHSKISMEAGHGDLAVLAALEKELETALENEDYELCEKLQLRIDELKN